MGMITKSDCIILTLMTLFSASCFAVGKGPAYATPEEAAKDPDFAIQGEYVNEDTGIQVIALSDGKFRIVKFAGGLPGAGWDGSEKEESESSTADIDEQLEGFTKTTRESPTLSMKGPHDAIVLFNGTKRRLEDHWREGAEMTEEGLLKQGPTSVETFGDHQLHIEFRLPFMPEARGQARGNSGCYVQGRYEVQMLDSFGLKGKDNECGGIYKASAPKINMAFPPLSWQTYDINFIAAKFDAHGKKTANARISVKHNGVVIHEDLELPEQTPGNVMGGEAATPGPVFLQDHGDPVRYRNIWVLPKS